MKTCKDCINRKICIAPCEWLRSQLNKVETPKEHLTFTDLNIKTDLTGDFN